MQTVVPKNPRAAVTSVRKNFPSTEIINFLTDATVHTLFILFDVPLIVSELSLLLFTSFAIVSVS